jgi:hypothetical protein
VNKYISVILVFFVLILLQGDLMGQDSGDKSSARIVFENENYDFGDVSNDTVLTHVFEFKNPGADTLFIQSVRGS